MKHYLRMILFIVGCVVIGAGWMLTTQQPKHVVIEFQMPQQKGTWI